MVKKARPARPQGFWRAERTDEYVSTTKDRERRWRTFSTFPLIPIQGPFLPGIPVTHDKNSQEQAHFNKPKQT